MKYIRTKEGEIFENHGSLQIIDNALCNMQNGKVWLILGEVLKQADTIEELCDEFVVDGIYGHLIIHSYKELKEVEFECIRQGNYVEIYGAIWTDKGLIYVAKMNEKGELELL